MLTSFESGVPPIFEFNKPCRDFSVRREKALIHSGREKPARELDRSSR
jgi:hypothetical protein